MLTTLTQLLRVIRNFTHHLMVRSGLPDTEEAIWTPEEQADYEVWDRDFGKPTEDPEPDPWLDWCEIEFEWGNPVPLC